MARYNFTVLLVEDSKHDVRIVRRAWRKSKISNPLVVVPHGQACLDYLRHQGQYSDPKQYPRPGIILMDIRMPIMDGIECLQTIKADPDLKALQKKNQRLSAIAARSPLDRQDAWSFYHAIYIPSITYSFPSGTMNEARCHQLQRQIKSSILPKYGFNAP